MQTQITEVVQCMYGWHKYMLFKHTNHYIDLIHVVCSYTSYHKNIYINPTWHIVFILPPPRNSNFHQTWRVRTSTNTCRLRCFSQHWLITDVQQWCWGCLPWWPLWKITTIGITYIFAEFLQECVQKPTKWFMTTLNLEVTRIETRNRTCFCKIGPILHHPLGHLNVRSRWWIQCPKDVRDLVSMKGKTLGIGLAELVNKGWAWPAWNPLGCAGVTSRQRVKSYELSTSQDSLEGKKLV